MQETLTIIKIGGNVIDDEQALHEFLISFSHISGKKILVHGGGKIATTIGHKMGIQPNYIQGRRITDDKTIDLVTMVYAGLVNKKIVAQLQALHCNGIGICGADGSLILAKKRPVGEVDFGWVGDIAAEDIPLDKWDVLLQNNWIPVVAPITHDSEGHLLNTNADTIASALAIAFSSSCPTSLIYCFEKDGVLADVNDDKSVLPSIDRNQYHRMISKNQLVEGILPKLKNAFEASEKGVNQVIVGNSSRLTDLIEGKSGTKIFV